mgnify:FL=1
MARSEGLLWLGGIIYVTLYFSQGVVFSVIMADHLSTSFGAFFVAYLPSICIFLYFLLKYEYAKNDRQVLYIWGVWFAYIVFAFVPVVGVVFGLVVDKLENDEAPGINTIRFMLCVTPVLLILLLTITISPEHWKFVITLSTTAALDLFDGIEMLEVILLQHQTGPVFLELSTATTACIVIFACLNFVVSPLALIQHKLTGNKEGDVKPRKNTTIVKAGIQIGLINLPFLILRSFIWAKHRYESSVFLTKNIISLVIATSEIGSAMELFDCGPDNRHHGQVNHL